MLDATKAFKKLVTSKEEVDGLPESALGLAAQAAAKEGHAGATPEQGPWLFTLDFPSYFPVRQAGCLASACVCVRMRMFCGWFISM